MTNDVDVDLGHLFRSLRRKWWLVLGVSLVVSAGVYALASSSTPLYRAETRVLIEARESVFTRPGGSAASDVSSLDTESVSSQVEVIGSAQILLDVARELNLASLEEFGPKVSLPKRVLIYLGLATDPGTLPVDEAVLTTMRDKLEIYRIESSRVIVIEFSSEDPQLAASVPNAIADAYVTSQRAAKIESNENATEWLGPEITDLRERVKQAESKVAEFRASSNLLEGSNNIILATQQLSELSTELSRVRASRLSAEARARTVRLAVQNGAAVEALREVQASTLVQRLRERQVELRSQIAELSTTLLSNHPRIRGLQSQLADLNSEINAEARKILAALEAEAESTRQQEQELDEALERQKTETARAESAQVELRALEREAASERELLESYVMRFREAAARLDRNYLPVDARIFARALPPSSPYYPKVGPMTIAAFFGSLLLMTVLILLQELFTGRALMPAPRQGVRDADIVPEIKQVSADNRVQALVDQAISPDDTAPPSGEVDVAAAGNALIAAGASRALFISPDGDEGASASVHVARHVAETGMRVLLLDLTISGAASLPMLNTLSLAGITNLLTSEVQFAKAIHSDLYSTCHIIPVGTADPEASMQGVDRLPIIMGSLTTAYDLVVVECGPTTVPGISSLIEGETMVLVSAIDRDSNSVQGILAEMEAEGMERPLLVYPASVSPIAPTDRDAA